VVGGDVRRHLAALPPRRPPGLDVAIADQYGNPIAINAYDEWGIPNASNVGRFGYTGQAWLPELGLWCYKARLFTMIWRSRRTPVAGTRRSAIAARAEPTHYRAT
jgi:hypothetical protein